MNSNLSLCSRAVSFCTLAFCSLASMAFGQPTVCQQVLWARQAGSVGSDTGYAVAAGHDHCLYLAGAFSSVAIFGTNAQGPISVSSRGGTDIFLAKYDAAGDLVWVTSAGGPGADSAYALTVDSEDHLYVTGSFSSTAIFGDQGASLCSRGGEDIFVAK